MEANSSPARPTAGDDPPRGLPHGTEQKMSSAAPRKPSRSRERSVKDTPSFQEWVNSGTASAMAKKTPGAKEPAVIATPAIQTSDGSSIYVQIDKTYKVRVETDGACTHVCGDLHKMEWSRHEEVLSGLICTISTLLDISIPKIPVRDRPGNRARRVQANDRAGRPHGRESGLGAGAPRAVAQRHGARQGPVRFATACAALLLPGVVAGG
jgi:hypothetical protein